MTPLDILDFIADAVLVISILSGLLGLLIKAWREPIGGLMFISSCIIFFDIWVWSLVTVHHLWGTTWMMVGIFIAGIGVIPMAICASAFAENWSRLALIVGGMIVCRGIQLGGRAFSENRQKLSEK